MYVLACKGVLGDPSCKLRNSGFNPQEYSTLALERCRVFEIRVLSIPCPLEHEAPGDLVSCLGQCEGGGRESGTEWLQNLETTHPKGLDIGMPICILVGQLSQAGGAGESACSICNQLPCRSFSAAFPGIPVTDAMTFSRYRIYLAAPLFSEAERRFNRKIAAILARHNLSVYLPQDAGDNTPGRDTGEHHEIFLANLSALQKSHIIIAVADGADADSGTAWEMGYAFANKIPVIALRTDFRMVGQQEHVNLMLEQSAAVVRSCRDLVEVLTYRKPLPNPNPTSESPWR